MKACLFGLISLLTVFAQGAAPFNATFIDEKAMDVEKNIKYYPSRGQGPRTLSFYLGSDRFMRAAGSFDAQSNADVRIHFGIDQKEFDRRFRINRRDDYRPAELSVVSQYGVEIFYVTWVKNTNNLKWSVWVNMSDAEFDKKWKELVEQKGYRVARHVTYSLGSRGRAHSVIFEKDKRPFRFFWNLSRDEFLEKAADMASKGFYPTDISAYEVGVATKYSAVWTNENFNQVLYIDMSKQNFAQRSETLSLQGYQLRKVIAYDIGRRFAAIWGK